MLHMPISSSAMRKHIIYMPRINSLQSTMSPGTLVYISHYWHMPLTNRPSTLHIHVSLHCYCSLQIESTEEYTQLKSTRKCRFITMLLPYMCQEKYASKMSHICHICQLVHVQIQDNCVNI